MTTRACSGSLISAVTLLLLGAGCGGDDEGQECIRVISCVRACDGPVVSSGCSCPSGTFDRDSRCPRDAGGDASSMDAQADARPADAAGDTSHADAAGGDAESPDGASEDTGVSDTGPSDAGIPECETTPCVRAYECVHACGQEPFYVGCCECPPGSIDRISCPPDAGPPECPPECFRPYICVEHCGGPVLSAGCCPCPPGTIDSVIDCRPDAGGGLGAGEACGAGLGECGAGLSCCYPCGIPGCTNVCEPSCTEGTPGCAGGCFLRP